MSTPSNASSTGSAEIISRIISENTPQRKVYVMLERRYAASDDNTTFSWFLQPHGLRARATGTVEVTRALTNVSKIRVLPFACPVISTAFFEDEKSYSEQPIRIRFHELDAESFNPTRATRYHVVLTSQIYEKQGVTFTSLFRSTRVRTYAGGVLRVKRIIYPDTSTALYDNDSETYTVYMPGDEFHFNSKVNLTKLTVSFPGVTFRDVTETVALAYSGGPGFVFTMTFTTAHDFPNPLEATPFGYAQVYVSGFTTNDPVADATIIAYINRSRGILVSRASDTTATLVPRGTNADGNDIPVSFEVTGVPSVSITVVCADRLFNMPVEITCD